MDTNDYIKILTKREQHLAAILDQFHTSDETHLQLVAAKMGPLLQEVAELTEELFCRAEQPEGQSVIGQNSTTPPC
ncbi:MAG: hypothetical protein IJW45_07160 [Oscillospiraceae bacterium]|nr:hypothetical protein [Oscillospiraceae bacterium]